MVLRRRALRGSLYIFIRLPLFGLGLWPIDKFVQCRLWLYSGGNAVEASGSHPSAHTEVVQTGTNKPTRHLTCSKASECSTVWSE